MILAGSVLVNGQKSTKPGHSFASDVPIEILEKMPYVGRGGYKLAGALDHWKIDVQDKLCIDVGASTGGFTDCLLQRGARQVYAIDVGHGQLDWKLRNDQRVVVREGVNARFLSPDDFPERFDLAVCDASFISLTMLIGAIASVLGAGGRMILLVKPQFELERGQVGKGGIVREPELHKAAWERVQGAVSALGFTTDIIESPILGAEGNREFLLYARHKTEN
jgi:23S rRNA (cytidine1920-2'-O)/16S rRNA (cytidine1409-2'-O)-methyltransferase